jgi:hypothetical protein
MIRGWLWIQSGSCQLSLSSTIVAKKPKYIEDSGRIPEDLPDSHGVYSAVELII